jgi:hypothetical protein
MKLRKLYGWIFCLRGKHERSENMVRRDGETYVSRCTYCGVRMRRRGKRDWIVDRGSRSK